MNYIFIIFIIFQKKKLAICITSVTILIFNDILFVPIYKCFHLITLMTNYMIFSLYVSNNLNIYFRAMKRTNFNYSLSNGFYNCGNCGNNLNIIILIHLFRLFMNSYLNIFLLLQSLCSLMQFII